MNRIRTALLIDTWFPELGGGQTNAWNISQRISTTYPATFDIFTRHLKNPYDMEIPTKSHPNIHLYQLPPVSSLFNWIVRVWWLLAVIPIVCINHLIHPYSIIHAHSTSAILPGKILSIMLRVPLVITIHGINVMETAPNSLMAKIENWLLTQISADQTIAVQNHIQDFSHQHKNLTIIPNGIDMTEFDQIKNSKPPYFKIVWLGRFDAVKGLSILISSFYEVIQKFPNTRLHLIGDGPLFIQIKQQITHMNLQEQTILHGVLLGKQKVKQLKSSHLFVLPSLSEGQPISLLEAAAAQLPIVATNVGDNKLFVTSPKSGWIVPPNNRQQLTTALIDAVSKSKTELLSMGRYNRQQVKKKYSWDVAADQTWEVYKKVLNLQERL